MKDGQVGSRIARRADVEAGRRTEDEHVDAEAADKVDLPDRYPELVGVGVGVGGLDRRRGRDDDDGEPASADLGGERAERGKTGIGGAVRLGRAES